MPRANPRTREKARSLFLSGQADLNAEIAKHLRVKPHTIAAWRKAEGWDELRIAVDRRAAEKLVEEIASDRVALNQRHYKFWELTLARAGRRDLLPGVSRLRHRARPLAWGVGGRLSLAACSWLPDQPAL
jgi:hypothetical protein